MFELIALVVVLEREEEEFCTTNNSCSWTQKGKI